MVSGINGPKGPQFEPHQKNTDPTLSLLYNYCQVIQTMISACESGQNQWLLVKDTIPAIEKIAQQLKEKYPQDQKSLDDIEYYLKQNSPQLHKLLIYKMSSATPKLSTKRNHRCPIA